MLLLALFQATLVVELFVFLFFFWPSIIVYETMTKRLSNSNAFGTAIGSCVPDPGCGLCLDMTTQGGTIQSMDYPNDYPPDLNCVFTIQSPSYTTIQLTFTTFSVENCCDFVSVFDGTSDPLQVGLNGYTIPSDSTSTGTTMTIKFTTNSDNSQLPAGNAPGRWKATYTFQGVLNRFLVEGRNQTLSNDNELSVLRNSAEF